MADLPILNSIGLALIGAALTFIAARYWYKKAADKDLLARIVELERQQGMTNLVAQPLWAAVQAKLVETLTHYHTPATDELLEKLGPPRIITDEEEIELIELMRKREVDIDDLIGTDERIAARMLPLVMHFVKLELAATELPETSVELKVVGVVVPPVSEVPPAEISA